VREDIYKDDPEVINEATKQPLILPIKLEAGYLSRSLQYDEEERFRGPIIFDGTVREARSYRIGGTDIVTVIDSTDGQDAVNRGRVKLSLHKDEWSGDKFKVAVKALIKNMGEYGVTLGAVGSYKTKSTRGVVWDGFCWNILKTLTGEGNLFIDLQRLYMLTNRDGLIIPEALPAIDDSIGMIGTPKKYNNRVDFNMIFEPGISAGQIVDVKSTILGNVNGQYIVQGFEHRGMISKAKCGELITSVQCVKPANQAINPVKVP